MIEKGLRRFGSNLSELAAEYEERGEDPLPVYRELGAKGLAGLPFDPAYGGGGRPYREYLDLIEELARSWVALAVGIGVHTLVCDAVQRFATEETRRELLPAMLEGERFGAYALTESSSGSDAASLRTRAKRTEGGYAITGRKQFCTRGGEADHLLVMARTGGDGPKGVTAFVVDRLTPGFRPAHPERKMAWRSSPTWELVFENCHVPDERRLRSPWRPWMPAGSGSRPAPSGSPRRPATRRSATFGLSGRRGAARWSRAPSSCSPTWRPASRPAGSSTSTPPA